MPGLKRWSLQRDCCGLYFSYSLKVLLDLFESFAFGFGQEEGCGEEVDNGECGKDKENGGVAVLADDWQEEDSKRGRDHLIDDESDAHAYRTNAGWHQLRQGQPDGYAGAYGIKRHEGIEAEGHQPSMPGGRDTVDKGSLDLQRRCLSSSQIREGILEEGFDSVGRHAAFAGDVNGGCCGVVGAYKGGCGTEPTVGVDDSLRGIAVVELILVVTACLQKVRGRSRRVAFALGRIWKAQAGAY